MHKVSILTATVLIMAAISGPAAAVLTVFTDRSGWAAAVGVAVLTEDFDGVLPGPLALGLNDVGLVGIEILDQVAANRIDDGDGVLNIDGSNFYNGNVDAFGNPSRARILTPAIVGFGGDWTSTTTGGLLTMEIDGELLRFADHLTGIGSGFLGVVSDTPLSLIGFDTETGAAEQFGLDNLRLAVSAVAEPPAWVVLGLGFLALVTLRAVAAARAA